jgi:hypothetical protein
MPGNAARSYEVDIDSALDVKWQTDLFLNYVATALQAVPKSYIVQDEKIATLRTAVAALFDGLDAQVAAAAAAEDQPGREFFSAMLQAGTALRRFPAEFADRMVQHKSSQPDLVYELNSAATAAKDGKLGALAGAIADKAANIENSLSQIVAAAPNVQVYMSAVLRPKTGAPVQLHLDGYDTIVEGTPKPFPRNRLALDARALADLQAAQNLLGLATDLSGGALLRRLDGSFEVLHAKALQVLNKLDVRLLTLRLQSLREQLEEAKIEALGDLLGQIRATEYLLKPISDSPILRAKSEAQGLVGAAKLIDSIGSGFIKNLRALPEQLQALTEAMRKIAADQPALIKQEFVDFLTASYREAATALRPLETFSLRVGQIADAVDIAQQVQIQLEKLVPRTLEEAKSFDTKLDLTRVAAERHPGDRVVVRVRVVQADEKGVELRELDSSEQVFRVEAYGPYVETRGALLFADPQSPVQRTATFIPTVGLGYHWKYGMRGNGFWNRTLSPGLGFSVSLLDFDDNNRFEFGAAASMTLFNDLLWLGYGRNFQAQANYFCIGFSPTEAFSLFRRRWD